MKKDLFYSSLFHHVSTTHDSYPFTGLRYNAQIMGDQDDAHIVFFLKFQKQMKELKRKEKLYADV